MLEVFTIDNHLLNYFNYYLINYLFTLGPGSNYPIRVLQGLLVLKYGLHNLSDSIEWKPL